MSICVGIDIGTVSVKGAVVGDPEDRPLLQRLVQAGGFVFQSPGQPLLLSPYRRTLGNPVGVAQTILGAVRDAIPDLPVQRIRVTGAGARLFQAHEAIERVNDFTAIASAVAFLHPEVSTVFEMGGESSRFLRLAVDPVTGQPAILDYETNGDCAAGTGAFMDQQAHRLRYRVEDVGRSRRDGPLGGPHRRPLFGLRQVRHDPCPAEGGHPTPDSPRTVRCGSSQFQRQHQQRQGRRASRGVRGRARAKCRHRAIPARTVRARRMPVPRPRRRPLVRGHRRRASVRGAPRREQRSTRPSHSATPSLRVRTATGATARRPGP